MSDGDQLSTFGSSGSTGFSNWVGKEIVDPEMLYTKVSRYGIEQPSSPGFNAHWLANQSQVFFRR